MGEVRIRSYNNSKYVVTIKIIVGNNIPEQVNSFNYLGNYIISYIYNNDTK